MISREHPLPLTRQCRLLNLSRSGIYFKYEEVYLKAYNSIAEAGQGLTKYFDRYNKRRWHRGLDNMTPDEV